MKLKRFLAGLGVLLLATVGVLVVTEVPALAYPGCSSGRVCTYWDDNGGGSMYYYTGPVNTCITIGYPWDNNISSAQNTMSGWRVRFWTSSNCTGTALILDYPGLPGDHANFGGWPNFMNDAASSFKFIP